MRRGNISHIIFVTEKLLHLTFCVWIEQLVIVLKGIPLVLEPLGVLLLASNLVPVCYEQTRMCWIFDIIKVDIVALDPAEVKVLRSFFQAFFEADAFLTNFKPLLNA